MNTHLFTLEVKTNGDAKAAELAVLCAFAARQPDGCEFHLQRPVDNGTPNAQELAAAIRDIADDLIPEQAEADEITRGQRDAAELLRCLSRLLERGSNPIHVVHSSFGAPGDFGYSTPIGKALAKFYGGK